MATREWQVTAHGKELKVSVPEREEMDKIDRFVDSISDDFLSAAAATQKGIQVQFTGPNFDLGRLPDKFQIALPPAKVREMAQWLLDVTADLV